MVREYGADAGIAFDGDADRVIFCDENGEEVNGDRIIGMLALEYKRRGRLSGNTVVVTSMSNLGLHRAMRENGIQVEVTDVGDRYVIERMRAGRFNIGGEQSGHIVFMDYATTGDGIISALHVLELMKKDQRKLSELAGFMPVFPQEIRSLAVARKTPLEDLPGLSGVMAECRAALADTGRIVVRFSGTENKIRILVEAEEADSVRYWADLLEDAARRELC